MRPSEAPPSRLQVELPAAVRAELERIARSEERGLKEQLLYAVREWLAGRGYDH